MLCTLMTLTVAGADADPSFGIHVIDEATGRGVPMVTLETVNRIRLVTDSAGWAVFDEPGLLGARVFFSVESPGYVFPEGDAGISGVPLETKPGETAEIKIMRLSIAERMYRVTGQGIYRDATKLGVEVPLPRPNLNGPMVTHGAVQVADFQGGQFWIWKGAQGYRGPGANIQSAAATSADPGGGGLDPSLGIHFEYLPSDRLLITEEPGDVQLEGLLSAKDADGISHLLAHYSRLGRDGLRMEHGIAEYNSELRGFEPVTQLGEEFAWQRPRGHAVKVKSDKGEFFYFASPFCVTRVPVDYDDVLDPSKYEALAWSADAGAVVWQTHSGPISQADEAKLVAGKLLPPDKALLQAHATDGKASPVMPASGSVKWNGYRKKWILIASETGSDPSKPGRLWYGEADQAEGPWGALICIVEESAVHLADPLHQAAFDQEDGRLIYFDCTVSTKALGAASIPRYERNRLMYRLDLNEPRLSSSRE